MAMYKGAASEAGRALQLKKKREKALEELEHRKRKIEEEMKLSDIENKFAAHYDAVEQQLKSSTIGLVTLDEMKAKQEDVVKERERQLAQKQHEKEMQRQKEMREKQEAKERQKRQIAALSFRLDDEDECEDEEEEKASGSDDQDSKGPFDCEGSSDDFSGPIPKKKKITKNPDVDTSKGPFNCEGSSDDFSCPIPKKKKITKNPDVDTSKGPFDCEGSSDDFSGPIPKKKKITKNPDVDTSFLPDRDREEEERKLREELRQEWVQKQEKLKNEEIEITFSYWDGSGHRRSVKMKKGHSIYQFLLKCLEILRKEFHELRAVTGDQLMYVKEDLIIPHHYTFYDFIVTKARGKSGPLFSFDVHDDVRLVSDATVEKDESHAGKVLLRSWYERNKHIFPASRWEPYDPTKNYDKYTIADRKK